MTAAPGRVGGGPDPSADRTGRTSSVTGVSASRSVHGFVVHSSSCASHSTGQPHGSFGKDLSCSDGKCRTVLVFGSTRGPRWAADAGSWTLCASACPGTDETEMSALNDGALLLSRLDGRRAHLHLI
jgi:hypothetical protein